MAAVTSNELAHSSSAAWPWPAPSASPNSISSLETRTRVSRSRSFNASCQARTVAISEVVMIEKLRHLERRVLQPAVPHGGVAEYLDATLGGCTPAHDREQQIIGGPAQRDVALAVLVR